MASAVTTRTRANILPHTKPPFTIGDLKKAIPPHCFNRSIIVSFSYLFYDLTLLAFFHHVASNYFQLLPHPLLYVAWPAYWFCSGAVLLGLWMIGHECGHNAFSNYKWLDDTVGYIIHTPFYVPYFSLKISHARHHSSSGSIQYDELYVPKMKSQLPNFLKYLDNPPARILKIIILFTFGWYFYLIFNFQGRHYDGAVSHFNPYCEIFSARERHLVWFSLGGIVGFTYGLYTLAMVKGVTWLLCHYVGPVMMMYFFLITITFLNHTHPSLPRYDSSEWDWIRGALTTVDRDYGVLNLVFHNVTDTHVIHHLFSKLPHYHAVEATNAIKSILGEYYNFDGTPILKAIYREAKECLYVEQDDGKGIYWYKN